MNELTQILADSVDHMFDDVMSNGMPPTHDKSSFNHWWNTIEEMGVTNLFLAEEDGGFCGQWQDAYIVFKKIGAYAIPLPVGETIIAKKILSDLGMTIGDHSITVGCSSNANITFCDKTDTAKFSGTISSVPWGEAAEKILVHFFFEGAEYYALLITQHSEITSRKFNEADEPRDQLEFREATVIDIKACPSNDSTIDLTLACALLRACQAGGALESALDYSIQHTRDRKQFGRALNQFQAIQHQVVRLAELSAAVNCAAQSACLALDNGEASFEIAAAKLRANQAIGDATSFAHQVHGAIGFTKEHRLHFFTQRLWSWRSEYGNDRYWAAQLGKQIASNGHNNLWPNLTKLEMARGHCE